MNKILRGAIWGALLGWAIGTLIKHFREEKLRRKQ